MTREVSLLTLLLEVSPRLCQMKNGEGEAELLLGKRVRQDVLKNLLWIRNFYT